MTERKLKNTVLLHKLRGLIEQARQHFAQTANSPLTMVHSKRIHREVLVGARARCGEEILPTLSANLVPLYGKSSSSHAEISRIAGGSVRTLFERQHLHCRASGQDPQYETAARAIAPFGAAGARIGRAGGALPLLSEPDGEEK